MLLIWGWRARAKKISEGEFHCPKCGVDRHYLLQRVANWFTLFFIPIFPTGKVHGERVTCTTCKTAFTPAVLDAPTTDVLVQRLAAAGRVIAVVLLRDGAPADPASRAAAMAAVTGFGNADYDEGTLDGDLHHVDASQVPAYVAALNEGLTQPGRESFLVQCASVVPAGQGPTAGQLATLQQVGAALGLSAAHVAGVLGTVQQARALPDAAVAPVAAVAAPVPEPVAEPVAGPPADWYPDPHGAAERRWWDGTSWTEHTQP